MNSTFRMALVWGLICFLLLYRTLFAEVVLSWQLLHQFSIPVWQLFSTYASNILPNLLPLACFLWLARKTHFSKIYAMMLPLAGWMLGRLVVSTIMWFITFKISQSPSFPADYQLRITEQLIQMYGSLNTLTSIIILLACGYAFWRECKTR